LNASLPALGLSQCYKSEGVLAVSVVSVDPAHLLLVLGKDFRASDLYSVVAAVGPLAFLFGWKAS